MDLSVIVCAHNEEKALGAQLDALLAQDWDGAWEIVVVDNGSTDGTAALVAAYAQRDQRVRLVGAFEKAGQSYGRNVGVRASAGTYLAFCDADDIVAPGWIAAIADGLGRHQVVTGPHELDLLNPRWLADSRGRSIEAPVGTFFGIFPCIRGAGWGIRRATWEDLGGMREDYRAGEDHELSLRCWLAGIPIVGIPDAVVHYRYRDTARALWRQGFAYGSNRPRIVRLLVEAGKPRPPRLAGLRSWILLVLRLPTLITRQGRASWVWIAANRCGQVVGSLRERTIML
ncbi:MAG: glycosyltransferase [Micropruina sp.]|nr:glycosyltransferase [Micropruina sp.]